jgi:hypothetical protein
MRNNSKHPLNVPLGIVALPLVPTTGMVVTYNLITLFVMVATGYGSFLLARHIVHNDAAALLAGTLVLCSPQRFFELRSAQLATLSDYSIPLALLCVLLALEQRRWRWVFLSAVCLLIAGLSKWYHLFHLLLVLLPLFVWRLGRAGRRGGTAAVWYELEPWARIALVSTICIAPFLLPGVQEALHAPYDPPRMIFYATPDVFLPDTFGGIWRPIPPTWRDPHTFSLVALLLTLAGLILAWRQTMLWATIASICLVMSLGALLHIDSLNLDIPLPYRIFQSLPVAGLLRSPYRINSVTTLMMGIIAAWGLARLFQRYRPRTGWIISLGVIVVLAAETIRLPFALSTAAISPFYQQLANQPGLWSVMDVPFNRFEHRMEMYAQIYHEHYILSGKTSRNMVRMPYHTAAPLAQVGTGRLQPDIVHLSDSDCTQLLRGLRVYYIVFHKDQQHADRSAQQITVARRLLGPLTQVYSDTHIQAYRLDAVAAWLEGPGSDTLQDVPLFLGMDDRWWAPETCAAGLHRWLPPGGAGFWAYTPHPHRVVLDVSLYSLPPGTRPLEVWLNGEYQQTLSIPEGRSPRHYLGPPLSLDAGTNLIELRAPAGGISPQALGIGNDTRALSFSVHGAWLHELTTRED